MSIPDFQLSADQDDIFSPLVLICAVGAATGRYIEYQLTPKRTVIVACWLRQTEHVTSWLFNQFALVAVTGGGHIA
ncbi:hypothetical protein LMH87_007388 [Akanthomyces muscarius]|uniref:Uncharacterized protein n=1 Tax=Akanthomyces muscarius TaxID=2231603 RepID=A0A9W8QSQ7_AKAMU|nr:hypothetical protein LMH87_007388 [Akanthomyces muscarius]KAJ4165769.1 hypothetical protein LMH87_007388 [Akanthomyces muscarius]